MNKAFKNKTLSWWGSKYYKAWVMNPSLTYEEWINAQPKKVINFIHKTDSVAISLSDFVKGKLSITD